MRHFKVWNR